MNPFEREKAFADGYRPAIDTVIREVVGRIVSIEAAGDDDDGNHATDYIVQVEGGGRIGARVRRSKYDFRDVTIRASYPWGGRTEIHKLGDVPWYLYAWTNDDHGFKDWMFFDVNKFLRTGLLDAAPEKSNGDGTTFKWVCVFDLLESGAVIASTQPWCEPHKSKWHNPTLGL